MSRGKGRGRRRRGGRGAQETQQTHQSRNPTTSSTVVAPQMPLSSKPTSNNPAYVNRVEPSTSTVLSDPLGQYGMEFDSFCSDPFAGFSDPLGQYRMEFDNFCAKHTSEDEGHQQIDSQSPSHEDVDGNSQPVSHEHLQKSKAIDFPRSGQCLIICAKSTSEVEGHQQIDSQPPSHEDVDGNSQPVSHEHLQKSGAIDFLRSGQCLIICAKSTSEVEGHQQIDSQPPSHEDVDGNSQPVSHEHLQKFEAVDVPWSSQCLSICAKCTSEVEGHQQFDSQLPSHEVVNGNSQPVSHEHLQKSEAIEVPWSGKCLSNDLTEFDGGLQENFDEDMFEAPSTYDPEYEPVFGHIVKKDISGLVGAIFGKYGDITRESDVRSPKIISFFLERICGVYQRLKQTTVFDLTSADINDMLDELRDLAKQKLNVGWLLEKVEQISETVSSFQNYSTNEREAAEYVESNGRIDKEIEQYRMQIAVIQDKISLAEEEKVANEAKANDHKRMAVDCYAKVKAVANESLLHGPL